MHKFVIALVIAVGFAASPPPGGYASCAQAAQDGRSDIPSGDSGYNTKLDRDGDGIACESTN